nr:unnamed protein product [Callosobruchus chinensis]
MGRATNKSRRGYYRSYSTNKYRSNANDVYFDQTQKSDYQRQTTFKRYYRGQSHQGNHYSRTSNVRGKALKTVEKPPSPVPGSEEYMVKKIEQTSALIMRQLLSPDDIALPQENSGLEADQQKSGSDNNQIQPPKHVVDRETETKSTRNRSKKDNVYSIEDVYNKIVNHIGNLKDGKKKNLINSKQSGYDSVVNHIATQERLKISRALRMMCLDKSIVETDESYEFINSIIPDTGIKIEELPRELIEQLSNTFDTTSFCFESDEQSCEKTEPEQSAGKMSFPEPSDDQIVFNSFDADYIKTEPPDDTYDAMEEINNEMEESLPASNKDEPEILLQTIKEESLDAEDLKEVIDNVPHQPDTLISNTQSISEDITNTVSIGTQTENLGEFPDIKSLLKDTFQHPPEDIDEAVDRMLQIDKIVSDLNDKKARQDTEVPQSLEPLPLGSSTKEEPDGKSSNEKKNQTFELHEKVLSTRCITVSEKPVVAVTTVKDEHTSEILAASYDNTVRTYDARRMKLTKMLNTESIVQCMDEKWEYAISEGARKVLLVGAKEAPVCFRDAITGLHLRTLQHNSLTCSVFSIIVDEGTVKHVLKAEAKKQISCIRLYKKLLFASCENGNIYIYTTTQNSKVGCIEGPGGSILSMEVVEDKIFVGTSLLFKVIPIPESILNSKCC